MAEELFAGGGNYYTILDAPVGGSIAAFRRAYKRQSLLYHPDKVTANTPEEIEAAQERFLRIRDAYEVLTDPKRKATYDRFGPEILHMQDSARSTEDVSAMTTQIIIGMAFFYIQYGAFVFIHTIGQPANSPGRTWSYGALLGLAVADGMMKFGGADLLGSIFSRMPIFEQVNIFRAIYPALMSGINIYTRLTWVDPVRIYTELLKKVVQQNQQIMVSLRHVVQAGQQRGAGGGGGSAAAAQQATAALNESMAGRSKKSRGPGVSTAAKGSKADKQLKEEKAKRDGTGAAQEEEKKKRTATIDLKTIMFVLFVLAWYKGWV